MELKVKEKEIRVLGKTLKITLKKRSLKDYGFVGMWKRRRDIKDGISYTKKIREWKR